MVKNTFITIIALLVVCGAALADPPIADIQSKVGTIYGVSINSTYGNQQLKTQLVRTSDSLNTAMDSIRTLQNEVGALQVDLDSLQLIGDQLSTTSLFTGTAAADSFTCFTVSGEVWMTGLSFYTTAGAGATSELCNFVLQQGATGGVIVRVGKGKDLNNLAAGVCQWLSPATAVLSDSLAYARNAASAANPIMEVVGWRMKLVDGSKIKLLMPGSSVTTKARASMNWYPAARGSKVTAG